MKGWWKVFVLGIIGSLVVQTVCGAVALKEEMTSDAVFIKPNSKLIASPEGLARVLENTQEQFLPISPPSMEMFIATQEKALAVDWNRILHIESDAGIKEKRRSSALTSSALFSWVFDPAHTAVKVTLVPRIFYADYLKANLPLPAPMPMRSMKLPAVGTHLMLGIKNSTNGAVLVQVGWPTGFTNRVEIYQTSDLPTGNWTFARTNIFTAGFTKFEWVDESATNQMKRFYVAGNADIDDDHDGLADARELFIYGSSGFFMVRGSGDRF